jgi:hypothetical protein
MIGFLIVAIASSLILAASSTSQTTDSGSAPEVLRSTSGSDRNSWFLWARWVAYLLTVMALLALVYWVVTAAGLELIFPKLGVKLWKLPVPGFHLFQNWAATRPLSLANALALLLMVFCFWSWHAVLREYLGLKIALPDPRFHVERARRLIIAVAAAILVFDLWAFYEGIASLAWGNNVFSFKAALATVGWAGMLVGVTIVSIMLQPHRKEETSCSEKPT